MSRKTKSMMDKVRSDTWGMAELASVLAREGKWLEISSFLISQWNGELGLSGCKAFMTGMLENCRNHDASKAFWTVKECMPKLPKRAMAGVLAAMADLASRSRNRSLMEQCFGSIQERWIRNGWLPNGFDLADAIFKRG